MWLFDFVLDLFMFGFRWRGWFSVVYFGYVVVLFGVWVWVADLVLCFVFLGW